MKLMADDMSEEVVNGAMGSSFRFSAVKPDNLGATEYTLVTIAIDNSGSVGSFANDLKNALKETIDACGKSARAENLLVRVITFNSYLDEIHGFKLLNQIDFNDYDFKCHGMTALKDATYSSIGAALTYGKTLTDQDFNVNSINIVITDGMDNVSKATNKMIVDMIQKAKIDEDVESINNILIGINVTDSRCKKYLEEFNKNVGFDQYVDAGDATKDTLAKLASFVSKSISSTSQALGTGGASQSLSF